MVGLVAPDTWRVAAHFLDPGRRGICGGKSSIHGKQVVEVLSTAAMDSILRQESRLGYAGSSVGRVMAAIFLVWGIGKWGPGHPQDAGSEGLVGHKDTSDTVSQSLWFLCYLGNILHYSLNSPQLIWCCKETEVYRIQWTDILRWWSYIVQMKYVCEGKFHHVWVTTGKHVPSNVSTQEGEVRPAQKWVWERWILCFWVLDIPETKQTRKIKVTMTYIWHMSHFRRLYNHVVLWNRERTMILFMTENEQWCLVW